MNKKLNQWELRKLISKKAKITKIDNEYYGHIKVDGEIINILIDADYLGIDNEENATINNVWDSLDLVDVKQLGQDKFDKMDIINVITK